MGYKSAQVFYCEKFPTMRKKTARAEAVIPRGSQTLCASPLRELVVSERLRSFADWTAIVSSLNVSFFSYGEFDPF